jgi:protein TonB
MSADLFVTRDRDTAARSRQSSLVVASILIHTTIIVALVISTILLPDVLPTPHTVLAYAGVQPVRLVDIPLPPRPPATRPAAPPQEPSSATPVEAPDGFTPEPETAPPPVAVPVQTGLIQGELNGTAVAPPPPPLPPPVERQPVRLHEGIEAPRKLTDTLPAYPALARSAGVQGVVIIEAIIDAHGDVVSTRILRSIPMLDQAAIDAVRQWKYTPARLNGEPVPVVVTVTVNFTLGR